MGEVGCLEDGHFQNLQVESALFDIAAAEFTGTVVYKVPVKQLVDRGGNGVIKFAGADAIISVSDSGGIFLVPILATHDQTIVLPAPSAATVGCSWTFVYVGDQAAATALTGTFVIETDASDTKILATTNAGDSNYDAAMAQKNSVGFTANAVPGTVITIVGLSATPKSAYIMIYDKESPIGMTNSISIA